MPHANGRNAILQRAIELAHEVGPVAVHPNEICAELGLSKSLVNFHFGGRDGLISEAIVESYRMYVAEITTVSEAAGDDPIARLMAWVDAQVAWTIAHPGLAAALNFPAEASSVAAGWPDALAEELGAIFKINFENMQNLVRAARVAVRGDQPSAKASDDPVEVALDASLVGWITLGLSVFSAGKHLPSADSGLRVFLPEATEHVKAEILAVLAR